MGILEILLIVYIVLIAINAAISIQLWFLYKSFPFALLIGVWGFTLVNFVLQGVVIDSTMLSVLAFSSYMFAGMCLTGVLCSIAEIPIKYTPYWIFFGITVTASFLLNFVTDNFTLIALPVAIALAAPQIQFAVLKLTRYRMQGPGLTNTFAVILLLNGLHFLDYPFLRPYPESAIFGFGAVLIFASMFGALLPTIVGKHHSNKLSDQLTETLSEMEKLARVKSDFLAHMSHEIRSPITGILGINELLLRSTLNDSQKKYCETMSGATNNLLFIINNVLSLSQLESGHSTIRKSDFSPTEMMSEIIEHYMFRPDVKSITFEKELIDLPSILLGDKGKILQIFYNLINNSIKYSGSDVIKLSMEFSASESPEGNAALLVTVTDYGRGIPEDQQQEIYAQFKQITTDQGGVGLGLSIIKEILKLLKGDICLTSEENNGTSFLCRIPIDVALNAEKVVTPTKNGFGIGGEPSATSESISADGTQIEDATERGERERKHVPETEEQILEKRGPILLVEDNLTSQMVMKNLFAHEGLGLKIVGTAEEALRELSRHVFRLIITDVDLPGMNGIEMIRFLRKFDQKSYIIVYSAFAYDEDVAKAIDAGANDYIRKPAHNEEIINKYHMTMSRLR